MNIEETLEEYGNLVEENVQGYLDQYIDESSEYHKFVEECYSDLEEFIMRKGKRIASCSTLLTYKGYGKEIGKSILTVSAGIELYRHAILIHDDMVDVDIKRRGRKTLHRIYSEDKDTRFGNGVATFLGNIAFSLAEKAIIDSDFPEDKSNTVLSLLSKHYRQVNESQILDLLFEQKDIDAEEWHIMASKRAASLFKLTFLTGGVLGEAPNEDLKLLKKAAEHIGYSFDIQDDIIDTFAEEKQYGRKPCRDIRLGKKPLHITLALEKGNPQKTEKLRKFLGKDKLNREEIENLQELIRETDGLNSAKAQSKKHAKKAKKLIGRANMSDEIKTFFDSLIDYVVESLEWYK